MRSYVLRHIRGELTLTRACCVNAVVFFLLMVAAVLALTRLGDGFDDVGRLSLSLARDVVAASLALAVLVGVWRSASRQAAVGGRAGAAAAKLGVMALAVAGLHYLTTTVPGRAGILKARLDPTLADFVIARTAIDEVSFTGALNDRAMRRLIAELSRPGVKVLRVSSHGGLIHSAMVLADVVRARAVAVVALDRCLSSCPLLLAASPNAIVTPKTRVVFHRPTPAASVAQTDRAALANAAAAWHARFRDYGIDPGAVAEMARREVWAPGFDALARMGMIKYVLDGAPPRLVAAAAWCRDHAAQCGPPRTAPPP